MNSFSAGKVTCWTGFLFWIFRRWQWLFKNVVIALLHPVLLPDFTKLVRKLNRPIILVLSN